MGRGGGSVGALPGQGGQPGLAVTEHGGVGSALASAQAGALRPHGNSGIAEESPGSLPTPGIPQASLLCGNM